MAVTDRLAMDAADAVLRFLESTGRRGDAEFYLRIFRAEAKERGWEVRDFRTGRKAAKVGIPAAGGVGLVVGGVLAGTAMRRSLRRR